MFTTEFTVKADLWQLPVFGEKMLFHDSRTGGLQRCKTGKKAETPT